MPETVLGAVGSLQLLYVVWAVITGGVWGSDREGCPEYYFRGESPSAYWFWVVAYTAGSIVMLVFS